jgi:hypothetical protein
VNQAASLQNLNDIVAPAPVGWWPPAPGWYLLAVLLLAVLAYLGVRWWLSWQRNRYRRAALNELRSIGGQRLQELPALLKRTALACWPREQVAALSGVEWHRFLDETAGKTLFTGDAGRTLDQLAYAGSSQAELSGAEIKSVVGAAEYWLRNHQIRRGEAA